MGQIVVSEFVSLDGVIEDPAGGEGFRRGGWVGRIGDKGREEVDEVKLDEALGTEALLLGRRSYQFFAARWPSRGGELADRLNRLPKYVVSSTLKDPDWHNSTVLKGDVVSEVSKLKQELNGDKKRPLARGARGPHRQTTTAMRRRAAWLRSRAYSGPARARPDLAPEQRPGCWPDRS